MIEIIPAIDLIDGKCVRLSQGDFSRQESYSDSPLDVARAFEGSGLKRLHIVDLDGAKNGQPQNLTVLEKVAAGTSLTIDFGGGIKSDLELNSVFNAGAQMASIGTVAVKEPELFLSWIEKFGGERFLLGSDVKDRMIAVDGWSTLTDLEIVPFLTDHAQRGVGVFVTDIAKDGLLQGPSIDLYIELLRSVPGLNLIASGGVRDMNDIRELERIGCSGVIVGKAIYEKRVTLADLATYKRNAG